MWRFDRIREVRILRPTNMFDYVRMSCMQLQGRCLLEHLVIQMVSIRTIFRHKLLATAPHLIIDTTVAKDGFWGLHRDGLKAFLDHVKATGMNEQQVSASNVNN